MPGRQGFSSSDFLVAAFFLFLHRSTHQPEPERLVALLAVHPVHRIEAAQTRLAVRPVMTLPVYPSPVDYRSVGLVQTAHRGYQQGSGCLTVDRTDSVAVETDRFGLVGFAGLAVGSAGPVTQFDVAWC